MVKTMDDYEVLKEKVRGISKEVSEFSIGKVEMILREESDVEDGILEKWKELTLGVCYDRKYCELLNADYNNLPEEDIKRIKVFALYLVRDNVDVLPVL